MGGRLFLPDRQFFESVKIAVETSNIESSPYKVLRELATHFFNTGEKLAYIGSELKKDLTDSKIIPQKKKRLSIWRAVDVHDEDIGGAHFMFVMKLAYILSLEKEGVEIYIITDNPSFLEMVRKGNRVFKGVTSDEALEIINIE